MSENTKIEWADHTFNPWRGCTKVSEGCAHCYAETLSKRNPNTLGVWGPHGTRVVAAEAQWRLPLKWNRQAERDGVRYRVFCASLADVFEDWQRPILCHDCCSMWCCPTCHEWRDGALPDKQHVPVHCYQHGACKPLMLDDVRRRMFHLIDATPHLDWILLTKRPENIRRMWPCYTALPHRHYRDNVWLLASVENQEQGDIRIPALLKCRDLSPALGLSLEPLLGPVSFRWAAWQDLSREHATDHLDGLRRLDLVIVGGESGPKARPMHPDWVRSIRDQCQAARVPFFFKQWGEYGPVDEPRTLEIASETVIGMARVGKKAAGRLLDGREWNEFPSN